MGDIASNHSFRSVAQSGEKHLHLLAGRILRFVQDDKGIIKRPASHEGQRSHFDNTALNHFLGTIKVNHPGSVRFNPYRRLHTLKQLNLPLAIERSMAYDWVYFNPVEWTGTMPRMNWATPGSEIRWVLRETDTGRENEEIEWDFAVGDVVKIRVVNDRGAFHAMQHPLHIHGQRFLVLSQNGVPNDNLVWKDTVLLPAASTTDILLELSNPGRWMIHCHIAEHLEAGMKMVMNVADAPT